MLSGETAVGDFPVEEVCRCALNRLFARPVSESHQPQHTGATLPAARRTDRSRHSTAVRPLAHETRGSVVTIADNADRSAWHYQVARLIAFMPAIIAASTDEAVVRQLAVVWGVQAVPVPFEIQRGDDRIEGSARVVSRRRRVGGSAGGGVGRPSDRRRRRLPDDPRGARWRRGTLVRGVRRAARRFTRQARP